MLDRWDEIKDLFAAALEHRPQDRPAFLQRACGGDVELRRKLEMLLESHRQADTFLEAPALLHVPPTLFTDSERPLGRVGPYQLLREIGHGGMGTVYLASRADGAYQKHVAVKIVRDAPRSMHLLERFRQERQLLANLDHPNIAKLLDGGTTEQNQPYLVMEYVDGQPIDRYCDQLRLSVLERLRLFRTVCAAVQFAHQNLIVHRDLKPDNILIAADGTPKLVDFGIAKALVADALPLTQALPGPSQRFLTYEYASPEQVRGEPITTATDVYSLAVVLYQLLTGRRPYPAKARRPDELERAVCETTPPRPSTRVMQVDDAPDPGDGLATSLTPEVVAQRRDTAPEKLQRLLRGDLDTIVLKALRKEPQRRYASVDQLSQDLHRYMEGLPVLARPDTFGYRAGKFLHRHRAAVVAALLVLLLLVAGLLTTLWQARVAHSERLRAERRFSEVRELARSVLFELHDGIAALPGSTPVRRQLVTLSLRYLEGLAAETSDSLELRLELAEAYRRVGDVQGNPYMSNLGDLEGASRSYRRSLAVLDAVPASQRGAIGVLRARADAVEGIADILVMQSDLGAALERHREALRLRDTVAAAQQEDVRTQRDLSASYHRIGDTLLWKGDVPGALDHHRRGLAIRQRLAQAAPAVVERQIDLASSFSRMGEALSAARDQRAALESYGELLKVADAVRRQDPMHVQARRYRGIALAKSGEMLSALGELGRSIEQQRLALVERRSLASSDLANMQARRDLAISHSLLADVLARAGKGQEALEHVRESLAIFEVIGADAHNAAARADLLLARLNAGDAFVAAGNLSEALTTYSKAGDVAQALVAADPEDATARQNLAATELARARVLCRRARNGSAGAQDMDQLRRATALYLSALKVLAEMQMRGMALTESNLDPAAVRTEMQACGPVQSGSSPPRGAR